MDRGGAADSPWRRRRPKLDSSREAPEDRGGAAAATRIVRGDNSARCSEPDRPRRSDARGRKRHWDAWARLSTPPRLRRGCSAETSRARLRYVAEAESEVAGYVLGRINERGSELPAPPGSRARTGGECDGHVTSLAVHARHRRRGVARGLMAAVHKAMAPDVATARLHVRCSNAQALQLYAGLGYDVIDVVQGYYHDGEAAYLMAANVRKLAAEEEAREAAVGLVA